MDEISKRKKIDKTSFNANSSRSHTIYRIKICNGENVGLLNIVDMAGAERNSIGTGMAINTNHAVKIRNEANFINKSLTTLGRVIRLIREQKLKGIKGEKLPVRESKLTTVLQDCFGGDALTIMLVMVTPDKSKYSQTKESLKFGSDAIF
jgi:hypothetical protein